jgi:hypothetical protein
MTTSEISNKNVIMALFNDMPEEVCKAFKECKKAREEKEMQELLACYAKDHHSSITQINVLILPPIESTKEVHMMKVSHPSTYVTSPQLLLLHIPRHLVHRLHLAHQ